MERNRFVFGALMAAVMAGAAWGQGAGPGPLPAKQPATEADQAPPEADVKPEVRPMRIRVSANVAASQLRDFVGAGEIGWAIRRGPSSVKRRPRSG